MNRKLSTALKIIVVVLVLCAVATAVAVAALNTDPTYKEQNNSDVKIVFLGDSIAEGVIGPSPVIERQSMAYPSLIGRTNGFTYVNRAVSGHKTGDMLEYISRERDDNAYTHISHIMTADVISVSILGNDLLQESFNNYLRRALDGDYTVLDEILAESYQNIDGIVTRLKQLNDKAPIIIQTVYNPLFDGSTLMNDTSKNYARAKGYTDNDFYAIAGLLVNRLNDTLYTYLVKHPGAFIVLDVNGKFDALYRREKKMLQRLIFSDCIHPSEEGHAYIYSALQQKLEELGLSDHDKTLASYKKLVGDKLKTMYTGTTVKINAVKKEIAKATTTDAVNEAYFNAIYGVTPSYDTDSFVGEMKETDEEDFEELQYVLESATVWGYGMEGFLDKKRSGLVFTENGSYELRLTINDIAYAAANAALITFGAEREYFDLDGYFESLDGYVGRFFPTETLKNIRSLIGKIKDDLGVSLIGIDPDDEAFMEKINKIAEEEKVKLSELSVPRHVGLAARGAYKNVTLPSEFEKDGYSAVYLGKVVRYGDPYFIGTYFTENGEEKILIHNEVLKMNVVFKKAK